PPLPPLSPSTPLFRSRQQRGADLNRLLERRLHEPRSVLLVPVAARVRERTEEPLRLRILGRRAAILHLARGASKPPRPALEDLIDRKSTRLNSSHQIT